ncbi:hypothetical protein [Clostridium nigeriense]|uniref:hypothetical protein n=1 Tax=Clostridium nigeriense TaxID=1805470 RepID=UPI00082D19F6|nr:hypothetical protein [Clostridium nigeriense]
MPAIYISKLNNEVKKNIRNRKYSLEEVEHIKANISQTINMRKKSIPKIIAIFVGVIFTILILGIIKAGIDKVMIFSVLTTIPIVVIIMGFIWFSGIGILKIEYNMAVRKGYPEYVDRLLL